ncbi:MAG: hypothetical protein OEZ68_15295 [Gammaproteobacteria bacterium]|nr:hypothetical protein [Gammaproteobacteria bacterium]MDH5802166.1 hypothetical protein [Gammaproteobacteria bacterium]
MGINHRRGVLVLLSLVATFVIMRIFLHNFPGTNLDIGQYNIHHLFTGLLLLTVSGLPLIVIQGNHRILDLAALVFGAGLSMALDEWVYLIATDGSDSAYLLPVSIIGATIVILATLVYGLLILVLGKKLVRGSNPPEV